MNEDFLNKVKLSKESIDWWMDESVQTAFDAEEIWWLYDRGEITEEELSKWLQLKEFLGYYESGKKYNNEIKELRKVLASGKELHNDISLVNREL